MDKVPARESDLALAISMAAHVAPIAMQWFSSNELVAETKADRSPVTQADRAVESSLRLLARSNDKGAAILGEEEGPEGSQSGRRWFFDPIDGTASFIRGIPFFSTLIALHDEHGPAVGVISLPALGEIIAAGRGLGCTLNGKPTRVSGHRGLKHAVVSTWGYEHWPLSLLRRFQLADVTLRGWSEAYGWALAATGRVDAVVDFGAKEWDLAPMSIVFEEAGGTYSSFDGSKAIDQGAGMGTNGNLHAELLALLQTEGWQYVFPSDSGRST